MRQLDAGYYEGELVKCEVKESKAGDPYVVLGFRVIDGICDKEPVAEEVVLSSWHGLSTDIAEGKKQSPAEYTVKTLADIGFDMNRDLMDLAEGLESNCFPPNTLVNLTIKDGEYNGEATSNIAWVNAHGSKPGGMPLTKEEAAAKGDSGKLRALLLKEKAKREATGAGIVTTAAAATPAASVQKPPF